VSIWSVVVHHVHFVPNLWRRHTARASTLLTETSAQAELQRPPALRRTRPQQPIGRIAPHENPIRMRRPPHASALSGFRPGSRPKQERSLRTGRVPPSDVCVGECVRKRDSTKQHHMDDPARTWSRPETGESRFRRSEAPTSAPEGIRTPNLLIRRKPGPHPARPSGAAQGCDLQQRPPVSSGTVPLVRLARAVLRRFLAPP